MKKIALITVFALALLAGATAVDARIEIWNRAGGNDSTFLVTEKMENKFKADVDNKADVWISELNVIDVSSSLKAGDDAEDNDLTSGTAEQDLTSDVSVNDTVILTPDCGCNASSTEPEIKIDNGDDDALFDVDSESKNKVKTEVDNELKYDESTVNVLTARTDLEADDDAERNTLKPGGIASAPTVKSTVSRVRTLNRTLIGPVSAVIIL